MLTFLDALLLQFLSYFQEQVLENHLGNVRFYLVFLFFVVDPLFVDFQQLKTIKIPIKFNRIPIKIHKNQ